TGEKFDLFSGAGGGFQSKELNFSNIPRSNPESNKILTGLTGLADPNPLPYRAANRWHETQSSDLTPQ
ncbi:MAG TPA: hypothetical protein VGL17_08725, partial [Gemmatimonadaceae bacterium]